MRQAVIGRPTVVLVAEQLAHGLSRQTLSLAHQENTTRSLVNDRG
jgi:hypothetical protein